MEEKVIAICDCGQESSWIISNEWICCNKCGQEYQIKVFEQEGVGKWKHIILDSEKLACLR